MAASPALGREWTDVTGEFQTEADMVSADATRVLLRKPDGQEISVALSRLCAADYLFVSEFLRASGVQSVSVPQPQMSEQYFNPFDPPADLVEETKAKGAIDFSYKMLLEDDRISTDIFRSISKVISDEKKKPWHFPALALIGGSIWVLSSLWFIYIAFNVSAGWGFGQLVADFLSCLLGFPGIVFAAIVLSKNPLEARGPFLIKLVGFLICAAAPFFIPSSEIPPPPSLY